MLKIGILGVGHLGKFHVQNWLKIEGVELSGFYDPNDATAKEVSDSYGITRYEKVEDLLDIVDAVDIVVPTDHHFPLCEAAPCIRRKANDTDAGAGQDHT